MGPPQKPKQGQPQGNSDAPDRAVYRNTGRFTTPPSPPQSPVEQPQPQRPEPAWRSRLAPPVVVTSEGEVSRRSLPPVSSAPRPPPTPPSSPAPETPQTPHWAAQLVGLLSPGSSSASRPAAPPEPQIKRSASTPPPKTQPSRREPPADMPTSTAEAHVHRLSMLNKLLDKNVPLTSAEARDRLRLTYMLEKNNLSPINIDEDNLFLGRYRATLDPLLLSTFGITHIVNCGRGYPRDEVSHVRFGYLHIKANDTTEERMAPYFTQASDFIAQALKSGGKVLIHCAAGISRSATILLAYLMRSRRWPLQQAFDFVKDKRSIVRPNPAFAAELLDWEEQVLGVRTTTTVVARNVQAIEAERMDWRQAVRVMFGEWRKGVPVCRDTGMAHLVWDEFKKAFPTPLAEDGVVQVNNDVLHDILSEAHAQIRGHAEKNHIAAEALVAELKTLQFILVMGSKYVPHVLPAQFLDAVRLLMENSSMALMPLEHSVSRQYYIDSFLKGLEEKMEKWLDQKMFTVYKPESPDWNCKKVEVWEPVATPAEPVKEDEDESKKRKFGATERVEMFLMLLTAQKGKDGGGGKRQKMEAGKWRFVLEVVERPKAVEEGAAQEKVNEADADNKLFTEETAIHEEKEDQEMVDGGVSLGLWAKDEEKRNEESANGKSAIEHHAEDEVMGYEEVTEGKASQR